MKCKINAHSSICLEWGKVIYFDPFMVKEPVNNADIICFTHSHYDHFSPEDIEKTAKAGTIFVAPAEMKRVLTDLGIPAGRMLLLLPGESGEVLGIRISGVPAYNVGKPFHPKENGWLGYVVELDGKRIYVAGDTDATEDAKAVQCDLAFLPVGGKYTMDAGEAAALAEILQPEEAIPTHYGSAVGKITDGPDFAAALEGKVPVRLILE